MDPIFTYLITYIVVILMAFAIMQWLTNGFITKFVRVKASRGQKVLVEVRGKLQNYFVVGILEGAWLIYKDNENKRDNKKESKRISLPDDAIYRKMNVNAVNVDETENAVIMPNMSTVNGYDPIKWNGLLKRALMNPVQKDLSKLVIVIIIGLAIVLVGIFILFNEIQGLKDTLSALSTIGGNVV